MQTFTINIENSALTPKVMWLLEHFRQDGLEIIPEEHAPDRWDYWSDHELDNFGKIAIGLSLNDYGDASEDYSQW